MNEFTVLIDDSLNTGQYRGASPDTFSLTGTSIQYTVLVR